MKNIFYIILTFILATVLVSCQPIEKRDGMGDVVASADQIQATATQVIDNGVKTNRIMLHCSSKVLSQWYDGVRTLCSSDTAINLFLTGSQNLTLTTRSADGTQFTKTFTFSVDATTYYVAPQYGYFCGSGSRTWIWAGDNKYTLNDAGLSRIWGNGGRTDVLPTWWGRYTADAVDDNIDLAGEMTFTLQGLQFSKVESGQTTTGSFSFDMNTHSTANGIGQITFKKTTILHGIGQNDNKVVVYVFDIAKLTNDEMILMYPTASNTYENWFWVFKRQGFTY